MKKWFVIIIFCTMGCASSNVEQINTVTSKFETIKYDDGINIVEAKVIAQRVLIRQNMVKIYDISDPKVYKDINDLPNHDNYWFISFKEKKVANIEFIFMAIINKDNGKVKFADDFKEEKHWILEAVLLGG